MELVDELAFPVPFQVISELLGMPTEREDEIRDWSQALTAALEPTADEATMEAAEAAAGCLGSYLDDVIAERRGHLGDDLLSQLLLVEEAGDRLSPAELRSFVVLLYVAGHETTVNLIGNGAARPAAPPRRAAPLARRPVARRDGGRRAAALRRPGPADRADPDAGRALRRRRGARRARR